jgi:SAM-dependent methyltransferase
MDTLRRNRLQFDAEVTSIERRKFFSPATYSAYHATVRSLTHYLHGKCLDIGCGDMPYRDLIRAYVTQYDSFDREKRAPEVTFVGDVQHMNMVQDATYDSAICLEVLEHVPNPFQAVTEIARVLKKEGVLVLSVPHLSRLHEEPNDFFRYTKYGLQALLENAGFRVLAITPRGGLFCFLGHQFSSLFVCLFWHVPVLKHLVYLLTIFCCVLPCYFLDKILDSRKVFALGYTCVAQKA